MPFRGHFFFKDNVLYLLLSVTCWPSMVRSQSPILSLSCCFIAEMSDKHLVTDILVFFQISLRPLYKINQTDIWLQPHIFTKLNFYLNKLYCARSWSITHESRYKYKYRCRCRYNYKCDWNTNTIYSDKPLPGPSVMNPAMITCPLNFKQAEDEFQTG